MKGETQVTVMVCTAVDRWRAPIAFLGKVKTPHCFKLLPDGKLTPLPYKGQHNSHFEKDISIWWINNVFLPEHLKRNGDVNSIQILDSCSTHAIDVSKILACLFIKLLPPNVIGTSQCTQA